MVPLKRREWVLMPVLINPTEGLEEWKMELIDSIILLLAMMRQNSLLYMIVRGESLVDFKEQIYVAMWYRAAITHAWVWPVCPCPIDCTLM